MMTRADFKAVADEALYRKRFATDEELKEWEQKVMFLAHCIKVTNPRFNMDKFLRACGMER